MACNARLLVVSGMAFEAAIAKGRSIDKVYGLDPHKLERDITDAVSKGVTGLLSFGVAAGLAPSLSAGTIVIARQVRRHNEIFAADATWANELARQLPDALCADIAGVDKVITAVEVKSLLHADFGTAIADMESHHVARLALRHHLPFAALRVVLDDAQCALPPAALAAARNDGEIDMARIFGSLLTNPAQFPILLRLGKARALARKSLLRCGHLLNGSLFGLGNLRAV